MSFWRHKESGGGNDQLAGFDLSPEMSMDVVVISTFHEIGDL